ncbi:MAG TPA: DUF4442 domain-containing protein [Bordetella sp.]|uniref:DUF4442 domain-containing protein n=1 Tax=Bordetella sp. TaxID=28081 RepID=UPI002ED2B22C
MMQWLARLPPRWRARAMRLGFNLHPAFRGTGGRVQYIAPDLSHVRVRLPLTWRTRNVLGTIYGGSLFSVTDGAHPTMLMLALGRNAIVWDKAATIRYRRPGRDTLYVDFRITPEEIAGIHADLARHGETERTYLVELKDGEGSVHAQVERTIYIADKAHYKQKISEKDA